MGKVSALVCGAFAVGVHKVRDNGCLFRVETLPVFLKVAPLLSVTLFGRRVSGVGLAAGTLFRGCVFF